MTNSLDKNRQNYPEYLSDPTVHSALYTEPTLQIYGTELICLLLDSEGVTIIT